jgi:TolB-like protein
MRRKWSHVLLFAVGMCLVVATWAQAGQVVTRQTRFWAKVALLKEKNLKGEPAPNTVGIVYFQNRTGSPQFDNLQKGLSVMLITDLSKVKEIELVERVKIQALMEELSLGSTGLVGEKDAPRVGRLLQVENLIGGDILKLTGKGFQLKADLLKVPTEKIFGQPFSEGELLQEFFAMEKELVNEILKYFKIKISAKKRAELREQVTDSLRALLHFFDGIHHSDLGDFAGARDLYAKALEEDPGFTLAREALEEIDALGEEECKALRNKIIRGFRRTPR